MPDIELLDILSIQYSTIDTLHRYKKINIQVQGECYINKISNSNPTIIDNNNNNDCVVDFFLPCPKREAAKKKSAKLA